MNYLEYDSPKIFFAVCVILLLMMIVVGRMTKFILERNVVKSIIWAVVLYIVAPLGLLLPKLASTNVSMPKIRFKDSKLIVKIAIISFFVILGIITYVLFAMFAKAANTDTDDGSRLI
jgi:Na+/melibiose symporter-like transporter